MSAIRRTVARPLVAWDVFPLSAIAAACVPPLAAPDVLGNPDADVDGDGWTPRAGDCDDADPWRFPDAPELCDGRDNGCGPGWSIAAEQSQVSWEDADGGWSDLGPAWGGGAVGAPTPVTLPDHGTVHLCPGTWWVEVVDPPGGSTAVLQGAGPDETVLHGGDAATVVSLSDPGSVVGLSGLALAGGHTEQTRAGSALSLHAGSAALRDCVVRDSAGVRAAVHVAGTLTMEGCEVRDNRASDDGGGLYVTGTATVSESTFTGNVAAHTGAAIYVDTGHLALEEVEVRDNHAGRYGGGVAVSRGRLEMSGGAIADNRAEEVGGGLFMEFGEAEVALSGVEIAGNESRVAGGVRATGQLSATDLRLEDNVASEGGGGLMVQGGVEILLAASRLSGNQAAVGGGLLLCDGALWLEETAVIGNEADGSDSTTCHEETVPAGVGGGIAVHEGTLLCQGSAGGEAAVEDNEASEAGGGVWLGTTDALLQATGCSFASGNLPDDVHHLPTETSTTVGSSAALQCEATGCRCLEGPCPE